MMNETIMEQPTTENLVAATVSSLVASDKPEDVLIAYGLGSCVAVCLYDPVRNIAGMLHGLLPTTLSSSAPENPAKFIDTGTAQLLKQMLRMNADVKRLRACLVGGAKMLSIPGENGMHIGERNVQSAMATLAALKIPILAQAVGGTAGRTVRFYTSNGHINVRSLGQEVDILQLSSRV